MNRLQKLPRVEVVPGDPGTPDQYICETKRSPTFTLGGVAVADPTPQGTVTSWYDFAAAAQRERQQLAFPGQPSMGVSGGGLGSIDYLNLGWTSAPSTTVQETRTCRVVPGRPAIPRQVSYLPTSGWNGGGRSIAGFSGDGYVAFDLSPGCLGAVVGLNNGTDTTSPGDCSHAFYVNSVGTYIMERGVQVLNLGQTHAANKRYRIERRRGQVEYKINGVTVYTSLVPSTGHVYLDAALYATGDYVDNPAIGPMQAASASTSVGVEAAIVVPAGGIARVGVTTRALGRAGDTYYGKARTALGVEAEATGHNVNTALAATALGVEVTGRATTAGVFGVLAAVTGFAAHAPTSRVAAEYKGRPSLESYGGFPEVTFSSVDGLLPLVTGAATGITGGIGGVDGVLPAADAVAAEGSYAFVRGEITGAPTVFSYAPLFDSNSVVFIEPILLAERWHVEITALATFRSVLQIGDAVELELILEQGFEWFDFLMAHSSVQELGDKDLSWADALAITSQGSTAAAGAQYATNVATGALSRYAGYDYLAVADTLRGSFGIRPDGIYRLGVAGAPVDGHVDFGANDLGERMPKRIEALFFGLTTDGEVFAVMQGDDGRKRTYRVTRREPYMRTNIAQGVAAKHWHLRLELFDATEAELQEVEFVASATTRRWTK